MGNGWLRSGVGWHVASSFKTLYYPKLFLITVTKTHTRYMAVFSTYYAPIINYDSMDKQHIINYDKYLPIKSQRSWFQLNSISLQFHFTPRILPQLRWRGEIWYIRDTTRHGMELKCSMQMNLRISWYSQKK